MKSIRRLKSDFTVFARFVETLQLRQTIALGTYELFPNLEILLDNGHFVNQIEHEHKHLH